MISRAQSIVTIPSRVSKGEELVVIPKKLYEELLDSSLAEERLLELAKESKRLLKRNKLPKLRSLAEL
ncbi:MAG: hypothetical protein A2939_01720 [Parcubacteria group bacterium RIFCSPLOWO2_01_FULL_48_18]|nr:MAG: hypothetical protein A3J67_04935 [Parcubacteria group bacterium RIFCSPHIGHO2_02_FULL_48_10b]OHB21797.1 MAG: hypothetical protein A2939_01720 [Parcubacteria group bacterium RIFCSPLOWO2_01_FULL_48_18]